MSSSYRPITVHLSKLSCHLSILFSIQSDVYNDRASGLDAAAIDSADERILHKLYIDKGNLEQSYYNHHLLTRGFH